jgi:hypothetical protein
VLINASISSDLTRLLWRVNRTGHLNSGMSQMCQKWIRGSALDPPPGGDYFDTMLSVTLAPAIEGLEHRAKRLALLGEVVLIAGRVDLV